MNKGARFLFNDYKIVSSAVNHCAVGLISSYSTMTMKGFQLTKCKIDAGALGRGCEHNAIDALLATFHLPLDQVPCRQRPERIRDQLHTQEQVGTLGSIIDGRRYCRSDFQLLATSLVEEERTTTLHFASGDVGTVSWIRDARPKGGPNGNGL